MHPFQRRDSGVPPRILLLKKSIIDNICRTIEGYPLGWMRSCLNIEFERTVELILSGDTEAYAFGKAEIRKELQELGFIPQEQNCK